MKRYIDMTPEERLDAYKRAHAAREAFEATSLVASGRGKRAASEAIWREADFIERVAKSRGDAWAQ